MKDGPRAVADAVLYEGFLLYPYAKSALKNQMPFQFGVVMPEGYGDPSEPAFLRAQFVVCGGDRLEGLLRFLQITEEPIAREIPFEAPLSEEHVEIPFAIDTLHGAIVLWAQRDREIARVTLEVWNRTAAHPNATRNQALRGAFASTHVLLEAPHGVFSSLLDPPEAAKNAVAHCVNERMFPVLTGESDSLRRTGSALLIAPIILYDFPQIADASRSHTFDGTEIDELLMLSVAALSEQEKREARHAHPYVRELLERAEALDADTLHHLHGELTGGAKPGDEQMAIAGTTLRRGSRVRVHPKRRADVWDGIVAGMTARVNAIHTDFEGKRYVGVVFDADPAGDLHEWYGRSFFYMADEVEPIP